MKATLRGVITSLSEKNLRSEGLVSCRLHHPESCTVARGPEHKVSAPIVSPEAPTLGEGDKGRG